MKKQLFGIAIILFFATVEAAFDGHFAYITAGGAAVGLVVAAVGFFKDDK